jgi:AraC-like DNA-binding protein
MVSLGGVVMARHIEKLVEYRQVRHSARSEASTYLTNQPVDVHFRFGNPIICKMLVGRKIMRVDESVPFEFLPGETMLVPSNMRLDIAFPDADINNPTKCICIELERESIDAVVDRINEYNHKIGSRDHFSIDWKRFALFHHDEKIDQKMSKLTTLYGDQSGPFRDILIDLAHQELVVGILQAQARDLIVERRINIPESGLGVAAEAISRNPQRRFTTIELAEMACMSEASLFRRFKARFGVTPARFASDERIRLAREMLGERPVSDVAFDLGYTSPEHFSRVFRRTTGLSPSEARRSHLSFESAQQI